MTMKRVAMALLALALAATVALAVMKTESDLEKDEIRALVEAAYINGAFNDLDTARMRQGFHPAFQIHGEKDGKLTEYPIDEWIGNIEKRKASTGYEREAWGHKLPIIDVTGKAAMVKVELFKGSEHVYTDYLSLLKLSGGWTITDKVYHRHPES